MSARRSIWTVSRGSDSNYGLTEETPVRTFAAAAALISPKVTDGVIWVTHTVTVLDEQTWDLEGRDCIVKRAPSCTGNMIAVDGGSLTLSNITIDGNAEVFSEPSASAPASNTIYLLNYATMTMNNAVVTNCFWRTGRCVLCGRLHPDSEQRQDLEQHVQASPAARSAASPTRRTIRPSLQ